MFVYGTLRSGEGNHRLFGNTEIHEGFESALAEFVGAEAALVFSSGYTANLGAVVSLSGAGSLLVSDALTHASLVDACRLSRARTTQRPCSGCSSSALPSSPR